MAINVRISIISAQAPGGNPGTGRQAVDAMIEHWRGRFAQVLPDQPDLIVVPECCDRFPQHSLPERIEYYQNRGDRIRDTFAAIAREHRCHITYPAVRQLDDGTWRNSLQLLGRNGEVVGIYDKMFPVITETEEAGILCGDDAVIMRCDFGRVGCAICFDLNFAEIRERYAELHPDLLLFSSMYHGGLMQAYWAYFCRCHLAAAICGLPGAIYSPVGHQLASTTNYFDHVTTTVNLDCRVAHLDFNGDRLRRMRDQYGPEVTVFDPGYLGSVLITSESDARSSQDLVDQFGIELLDDYMERSTTHRRRVLRRMESSARPRQG